jgi:hypothetical protein
MGEFARKPTDSLGFKRVAGDDIGFGVAAFEAFERPTFETIRSRQDIGRFHPGGTLRTARTLDGQQFRGRFCHGDHRSRVPSRKLRVEVDVCYRRDISTRAGGRLFTGEHNSN